MMIRYILFVLLVLLPGYSISSPLGHGPDADDTHLRWINWTRVTLSGRVRHYESDKYYVSSQSEFNDIVEDQICQQYLGYWYEANGDDPYTNVELRNKQTNSAGAFRCRVTWRYQDSFNGSSTSSYFIQSTRNNNECPEGKIFNWRSDECQEPCPGGEFYRYFEGEESLTQGFHCKRYADGYCTLKTSRIMSLNFGDTSATAWGYSTEYTGTFCHPDNFNPGTPGSLDGPKDDNDEPVPTSTSGPTGDDPGSTDGTTTTTNPDGSTTTTGPGPDAPTITVSAGGDTTTTTTDNGDGSTTTTTEGPEGTTTTTENADGSSTTTHADGSTTTCDDNGTCSTVDADGYDVDGPDTCTGADCPGTGNGSGGAGTDLDGCDSWISDPNGDNFICADGYDTDPEPGECVNNPQSEEDDCAEATDDENGGTSIGWGGECSSRPECDDDSTGTYQCVQIQLSWEHRCLYEFDGDEVEGTPITESSVADDGSELFEEFDLSTIDFDTSGFVNAATVDQYLVIELGDYGTHQIDLQPFFTLFGLLGYLILAAGYFHAGVIILRS